MDTFYPELDVKTLRSIRTIKMMLAENPSYFLESPYGGEIEQFFIDLFPKATVPIPPAQLLDKDAVAAITTSANKYDNLIDKTAEYIVGLDSVKNKTTDSGEEIQFYKAITGLMEKLVGLQERLLGMKQVSDFHRAVIDIMNDVCTPDQRTKVMDKLDSAIKGNS